MANKRHKPEESVPQGQALLRHISALRSAFATCLTQRGEPIR